jgi:serine protease AprX
MGQGEGVVIDGSGSQTGGLNRWGDYSSLNVDPSDDCTFWFTSEYLASSGSFNWRTRVGTFKLSGCGSAPASDFSLGATPSSQSVTPGQGTSYGVTITPSGGFSAGVTLGVSGLPAGANGSFSPNPATSSSTLSVTTTGSTPAGTYPLTITGTGGGQTHTTSVTLVVQGTSTADFVLTVTPDSRSVDRGRSTYYNVAITRVNGFTGAVSLSVGGLPSMTTGTFSLNPATTKSKLTVKPKSTAARGTYTLTITGTNGSLSHAAPVTLVIR